MKMKMENRRVKQVLSRGCTSGMGEDIKKGLGG
jgi:hypothetical protein